MPNTAQDEEVRAPAPNFSSDVDAAKHTAAALEHRRVDAILDLGRRYEAHDLAQEFVRNPQGRVDGLTRALLERRGKTLPVASTSSDIGMSQRDLTRFSICKIVRAISDPLNHRAQDDAAFEREMSEAAAKNQHERHAGKWVIPSDVLRHNISGETTIWRDGMSAGTNGQTGPVAESYLDTLRSKAVFTKGTHMITGLIENVEIPMQTPEAHGF